VSNHCWAESCSVDYGSSPQATRYAPRFTLLAAPAVAPGRLESAVWVPYLPALPLGIPDALLAWRTP
jgi:hypothetical protein